MPGIFLTTRTTAVSQYRAGASAQEVADRIGCHWWTVVLWHRETG